MLVMFCVTHPKCGFTTQQFSSSHMSLHLRVAPVASRQIIYVIDCVIQNAEPLSFGLLMHLNKQSLLLQMILWRSLQSRPQRWPGAGEASPLYGAGCEARRVNTVIRQTAGGGVRHRTLARSHDCCGSIPLDQYWLLELSSSVDMHEDC